MAVGFFAWCVLGVCISQVLSETSASDHSQQRGTAHLAYGLLADELKECRTDADCINVVHPRVGPMTKCLATNVCYPPDSADFRDSAPGSCTSHRDCGAYYMCLRTQCLFIGPKGCTTAADCPQGSPLTFECVERPSAPGTKCYIKCSTDAECYLCDGVFCHQAHEETVPNYGCCQGSCQKRKACELVAMAPPNQ